MEERSYTKIIARWFGDGKESRSTTIEEEILKIISELVMTGRTSGIKTAADFFPMSILILWDRIYMLWQPN
jgi:hypothetical protein